MGESSAFNHNSSPFSREAIPFTEHGLQVAQDGCYFRFVDYCRFSANVPDPIFNEMEFHYWR